MSACIAERSREHQNGIGGLGSGGAYLNGGFGGGLAGCRQPYAGPEPGGDGLCSYGWEPGWNIDGYYDSDGWVALGGVAWPNEANDVVGYLRLTYHSGQVAVSIAGEWSIGFDTDCQPVVFSTDPLLIGEPDPNQMMQGGGPDRSIFEIKGSEQTAADSGRDPAEHSNLTLLPVAPAEPMSDGGAAVYTMGAMDCSEVLDPNFYPNLNDDPFVNFADAAILAANWLASGPSLAGDFDGSEQIDFYDLAYLAYFWGASACGPAPEDVFAEFKAALQSGNINEALTFIADSSRDRYAQIFSAIEPNLPDFAAGLGDLTLSSQASIKAVYEMAHQDGEQTYSFPVVFVRDEHGNWEIFNF